MPRTFILKDFIKKSFLIYIHIDKIVHIMGIIKKNKDDQNNKIDKV